MKICFSIFISVLLTLISAGCHNKAGRENTPCRVVEAAYNGDVELLRYELDRGCDPRGNSDQVNEPIYAGIVFGNLAVVESLLDAGVDPRFDWGERGGDFLTNAVQFGHKEIVELLIERGANINRSIGHSALYRAMIQGNDMIEDFLRSNGAELNSRDKEALDSLSMPY